MTIFVEADSSVNILLPGGWAIYPWLRVATADCSGSGWLHPFLCLFPTAYGCPPRDGFRKKRRCMSQLVVFEIIWEVFSLQHGKNCSQMVGWEVQSFQGNHLFTHLTCCLTLSSTWNPVYFVFRIHRKSISGVDMSQGQVQAETTSFEGSWMGCLSHRVMCCLKFFFFVFFCKQKSMIPHGSNMDWFSKIDTWDASLDVSAAKATANSPGVVSLPHFQWLDLGHQDALGDFVKARQISGWSRIWISNDI